MDARMLGHSGIGIYIQGLLVGLESLFAEDSNLENRLLLSFLGGHALFAKAFPGPLNESSQRIAFKSPLYTLREQFEAARRIKSASHTTAQLPARSRTFDRPVAFWPHYNFPIFWRGPLVVTIHDLIHHQFPPRKGTRGYQAFMLRALRRRLRRADRGGPPTHVLTVSRPVKVMLQRIWRFPPHRVWNIGEPLLPRFRPPRTEAEWQRGISDSLRAFRLPDRYWLTVGLYKPHKNFAWLLDRLKRYWASGEFKNLNLVMAGTNQARELLQQIDFDDRLRGRVKVLSAVTDEQIRALFWGAEALLFPSLTEGFGLPVLEAMACGTPVICSRRAPMNEFAADVAWFFDPERPDESDTPDELLQALRIISQPRSGGDANNRDSGGEAAPAGAHAVDAKGAIQDDPATVEECLRRGVERARRFNPADFAARVLEIWYRAATERTR
jgi:glycosyltransferase involved in cell wall biosynthesis